MRLVTAAQMKEIEGRSAEEFDLSAENLMEVAGALAAREIQQAFLPELSRHRVAVICGPGNNGGDGLVVARHLYAMGFLSLQVFYWAPEKKRSKLFRVQLTRAVKQGIRIVDLEAEPKRIPEIAEFGVIIDGLFGIGLQRTVEDRPLEIIRTVNSSQATVASLDIPSGLSSDSGAVMGDAVRAAMTLTFGLAKSGLYVGDGSSYTGRVRILQIGLPRRLFREVAHTHFAFNERLARRWLPTRKERSHKAQHGHLLVIAGSPGMWGAAQLSTEAAYRIGAGYVTLAAPSEESLKFLGREIGSEVLVTSRKNPELFEKKNAVVIGPGAGVDQDLKNLVEKLHARRMERVLLDADALTALSEMSGAKLLPSWILTPHSGELSRLLGVPAEEIEKDRLYHASKAAEKFGCLVLLKGFRSILANHEGRVAVVVSGNAGLAKAGTGDVLSGLIGGLLAQGVGPLQAAGTGAYLHGRLADEWLRLGRDAKSLMPRDLLALAPELIQQISRE
jgi:ADP-dependent NAD(P)H-hydrate dehydratase / NAD(P)H-hydrate epimerase